MVYVLDLNTSEHDLCLPELEGGDVPGGDDGPVVPGQVVAAVSAHLGGPGVAIPDRQPVKPAAPTCAILQPELGELELHNLDDEDRSIK